VVAQHEKELAADNSDHEEQETIKNMLN